MGGVVTPASPSYLHDLVMAEGSHPELVAGQVPAAVPVLGVCGSARGWVLYEVVLAPPSVRVFEGLTEA